MAKNVVKKILNLGGLDVTRYNRSKAHHKALYKKYSEFTMVPEAMFRLNLDLCEHFRSVNGDYVECGVWRGGMSAAIAELIGKERTIHLFDSFQGLPQASEIDGKEAIAWQNNPSGPNYFDNCAAEKSFAIEAMKLAGHSNYKLYEGWFEKTLPDYPKSPIAILRLDGDWYESIISCLRQLFPYVSDGGVVVLDDYYTWDGCAKAVHDYLAEIKSPSRIYQWKDQIAYIRKKNE